MANNVKNTRIHRRALLRGALGSVLALPLLDIMMPNDRAYALVEPRRFLFAFGGQAMGWDIDNILPKSTAAGWSNTVGLKPVFDAGLEGDAIFVSGLEIPMGSGVAHRRTVASTEFHGSGEDTTQVTGLSSPSSAGGPSVEYLMAEQQAMANVMNPLSYRLQAFSYLAAGDTDDSISYSRGTGGVIQRQVPVFSPVSAYNKFTSFSTASPEEMAKRNYQRQKGVKVLDLVAANADRLKKRLGTADQQRLNQYFQEVSDFETRLRTIPVSGACGLITGFPTTDPGAGKTQIFTTPDGDSKNGYTAEADRAPLFGKLIKLAFKCDLARAASLLITSPQCFMSLKPMNIPSIKDPNVAETMSIHAASHYNDTVFMQKMAIAKAYAWQAAILTQLATDLKNDQDPDGVAMLDRTAIVFTLEGGSDRTLGDNQAPHSTKNMGVLMMGGKKIGLNPGRHIVTQANHPCEVILSGMRAVGYTGALGEVKQGLSAILP